MSTYEELQREYHPTEAVARAAQREFNEANADSTKFALVTDEPDYGLIGVTTSAEQHRK